MKILIADDDFGIRGLVETMLEALGYESQTIDDGDVLYDILTSNHDFDLVLTDVMMPTKDGISAVTESNTRTPVIFMSGVPREIPEKYEFLQKPFSIIRLSNILKKALQKS